VDLVVVVVINHQALQQVAQEHLDKDLPEEAEIPRRHMVLAVAVALPLLVKLLQAQANLAREVMAFLPLSPVLPPTMAAVVVEASLRALALVVLAALAVAEMGVLLVLRELLEQPTLAVVAGRLDRLALWVVLAGLEWLLFPFHPAITLGQ
jgi:hypothetical protein